MRISLVIVALVVAACGCGNRRAKSGRVGLGRAKETVCPATREPGNAQPGTLGTCKADQECTTGKNGRCRTMGDRTIENRCTYDACVKDADCTTGGPCECDTYRGNYCAVGNCRTDTDCGAGGSCGRSNSMACRGGAEPSYFCRSEKDDCGDDSDCKKNSQCIYSSQVGHWTCEEPPECPVG